MVMAGSGRGVNAYNFNFSRALVKLWSESKDEQCATDADEINLRVNLALKEIKGTAPDQDAQVVVEYGSNFCIESFASNRSLAFLFNPGNHKLRFTYRDKLGIKVSTPKTVFPGGMHSLSLKPADYLITVLDGPASTKGQMQTFELSLRPNRVEFRPLAEIPNCQTSAASAPQRVA